MRIYFILYGIIWASSTTLGKYRVFGGFSPEYVFTYSDIKDGLQDYHLSTAILSK